MNASLVLEMSDDDCSTEETRMIDTIAVIIVGGSDVDGDGSGGGGRLPGK